MGRPGEYEVKNKVTSVTVYSDKALSNYTAEGINADHTFAVVLNGTRYEGLTWTANDAGSLWWLGGMVDFTNYPFNLVLRGVKQADGTIVYQDGLDYGVYTADCLWLDTTNNPDLDPSTLELWDESETGINPVPMAYLPITYGTTDLEAGVSPLAEGTIYIVYEE